MTLPIGSRAGERRGSKPRDNLPAGSVFLYAFDLIELVVGEPAPLFLDLAAQLLDVSFDRVLVHVRTS